MELFYPSLLFTFLLILLKLISRRISSTISKLPPGPPKLPIIGSMHHLLRSLPHRALRDLAKTYGPLMHLKLGEVSMLIVSSAEAAREIMRTHDITFASRPHVMAVKIILYGGTDMIFAPYGDYWRQLRKICVLELLSPKRVQSFQSIREEEVFSLIQSIYYYSTDGSLINLSKKLNSLTNDITSRAAFGTKCEDQATFLSALKGSLEATGGFDVGDLFPSFPLVGMISGIKSKAERCHRKLDRILDSIIPEHKERKNASIDTSTGEAAEEDLVDVLLRVQEKGGLQFPLTSDIIKGVIFDVFGAGSETSGTTLGWVMSELMRNPGAMKKAQSEVREVLKGKVRVTEDDITELNYLKLVIKETLRLHPLVPLLLPRENKEACEVLGYEIPTKTKVFVNVWAMGRDPQYWDDAEDFKPERFDGSPIDFKGANFEYIPFGAGRRICPGMLFGLTSVELALAQLLYYFDWKLPHGVSPSDLDMTENFGSVMGRKSDLCLHAMPYIPCPMA